MRGRRRSPEDFAAEIEAHIRLESERLQEQGMSAEDAWAAAHRRFGNVTRAQERFWESGRWIAWDHFRQDVRYGARTLRKSPAFTAIAILTIALGVGATSAIFSLVDATLLRPLPYPHPEQLVSVRADTPGIGARDTGFSQPEWEDLRHSGIFQQVSPSWFDENNLTGSSQPERIRLLLGSPDYFALLGVRPQLGRTFDPLNHDPGLVPEVVISDALWKRSFAGDPRVLEKSIRMDTDLYRIVGVMPAGFDAPGRTSEERNIEIWAACSFYGMPLPDHPPRNRRFLPTAIARLQDGLTIAAAQSRLDALVSSLAKQFPADYPPQAGWTVRLLPLQERLIGDTRQSLLLLLGAVGLVLLIGCINLANLQLARSSARAREIAIRQALGAGRRRLISQLLTESLLLSTVGGLLGLAILFAARPMLLRLVPRELPRLNEVAIDWRVAIFALAASAVAGMTCGLAPALRTHSNSGRFDLATGLKEGTRGSTGSGGQARSRGMLVVAEFALSVVLLAAATLLLRSFRDLLDVEPGFRPEGVVTVRTRLPAPNDPKVDLYGTPTQEEAFLRELLRRSRRLGVEEAAIGDTASIPLDPAQRDLKVISEGPFLMTLEGREGTSGQLGQPILADQSSVTPGYFHLLGLPLLRGRWFEDRENEKTPLVALVNEAFARRFWPNEDPVGKRFRETRARHPDWITVVGLIADARTESLAEPAVPKVYLDLYQTGGKRLAIFLRGATDKGAISASLTKQIRALDPTLPVFEAQTLGETASASLAARRFSMEILALFALTALLLAGLGIYGVISYMVGERRREIGIRIALGASRRNILRMVLGQGLGLAAAGAAVGVGGGLIVSHLMSRLLYGVSPTDPLTFASVVLVLLMVALAACSIPARRATRLDPLIVLREA